jgi:beta-N-acetylhexosaminidase
VLVVGIPGVTTAEEPLGQSLVDMGVGGLFLSEPNVESPSR